MKGNVITVDGKIKNLVTFKCTFHVCRQTHLPKFNTYRVSTDPNASGTVWEKLTAGFKFEGVILDPTLTRYRYQNIHHAIVRRPEVATMTCSR
jgi:hypothetical protein